MSKTIKLSEEELTVLRGYQQKQNHITFNNCFIINIKNPLKKLFY